MESVNIFQRINRVMQTVKFVKKDANVSGYKAVTHDQVLSVARASLVENGVVIYPEQLNSSMPIMRDPDKGVKMHLYSADYAIHFVNMDNPEDRISVTINAQANDNGDKAPGKAVTYATKTAILKVLCLETGESDESRTEHLSAITGIQVKAISNMLERLDNDVERRMLSALDVEAVEEIPKSAYNNTVARLKKALAEAES
jgi:hypothetical protein